MSAEKQKLYDEIDTLPNSLTNQVIDYIEYLKFSYADNKVPEGLEIKSKKDLKDKLQEGLDDIKEGRVYSVEEVFTELDKI